MLTDTLIPGTTAAAARTVLRLADDWDLPALAAERVSWAKVVDQRISLSGAATARVIAGRVPGESHVSGWSSSTAALIPQIPRSRPNSSPRSGTGGADGLEGSSERQVRSCGAIKKGRRASYLDVKNRGC